MSAVLGKPRTWGRGILAEKKAGVLVGVGLGPGDPELMTLKAARLISAARVIAYPGSVGGESFARSIAAAVMPEGVEEIVIEVPFKVAREPAQAAYDAGAAAIAAHLEAGRDVVCLCEGDPLFYGSFMYLFARLSGRFEVQVVPGVSSVSASAARAGLPLVARNEVLSVLPGPLPEAALRARIGAADTVVLMKVGQHMARLRSLLDDMGLLGCAVYVERVGLADEVCLPLAEAPEVAPYFSMILVRKGSDPWL